MKKLKDRTRGLENAVEHVWEAKAEAYALLAKNEKEAQSLRALLHWARKEAEEAADKWRAPQKTCSQWQ